ncbi:MAG: winged helix-turn-helix transcriptional regulator [Salinirussus sp.]
MIDGECRCAASELFGLLGRKYALDILCVVANHGTARFGEIEDHLPGASTTTVSSRLDELVTADLVFRERYDEIPPRVEYGLTDDGWTLAEHLEPVARFAADYPG